jgi:hypothetical protein
VTQQGYWIGGSKANGMIQGLELLFVGYPAYIAMHGIEEVQKGHAKGLE